MSEKQEGRRRGGISSDLSEHSFSFPSSSPCELSPARDRQSRSVILAPGVLGALGVLSLSCASTVRAKGPASDVVTANLVAPAGVTLAQACTPTGPELCFNAVDDNCNGVIDEGCGLET